MSSTLVIGLTDDGVETILSSRVIFKVGTKIVSTPCDGRRNNLGSADAVTPLLDEQFEPPELVRLLVVDKKESFRILGMQDPRRKWDKLATFNARKPTAPLDPPPSAKLCLRDYKTRHA